MNGSRSVPASGSGPDRPIDSIALRAFALLECVARAPGPLSLDEITGRLQLPKPTVYRILKLLHTAGMLSRDATSKRVTLGPRLSAFAVDLWKSGSLRVEWHRALEDVVAEIGETCQLTQLEGNRVLFVDRAVPAKPARLCLDIGMRAPLHCSASGKLFLAAMDPKQAKQLLGPEPYERFTDRTITRFSSLEGELEEAKRTGIATQDGELVDDSLTIAVPVVTPRASVAAAVSVNTIASRGGSGGASFVEALARAATRIASTMSFAPGSR